MSEADGSLCTVPGCDRPGAIRGLCKRHDMRVRAGIDLVTEWEELTGTPSGFGRWGELTTVGDDKLLCHECGRAYRSVAHHSKQSHSMTADEYRAKHGLGNLPLVAPATKRKLRAATLTRIGTPAWDAFVSARDDPINRSAAIAAAAATPRSLGTRKVMSDHGTGRTVPRLTATAELLKLRDKAAETADRNGHGIWGTLTGTDTHLLCHECGRAYKSVSRHIRRTHSMTDDEYRTKHGLGDVSLEAPETTRNRSHNSP